MSILARTSGLADRIIGQINTDYSSLSSFESARQLNVYSSIATDVSSLIASTTITFVNWQVVFAFNNFPTTVDNNESALKSADFGTYTTARFGQAKDNQKIIFQCQTSKRYGYTYGIGSATYPRGRYNLPNTGVTQWVTGRNIADVQVDSTSSDTMYIKSAYAETDATLQLQIQYLVIQWQFSTSSYNVLDI